MGSAARMSCIIRRTCRTAAPAAAVGLLFFEGARAVAADRGPAPSEAVFLTQIVVLLVVGRLLGEAMQRLRQPSVMGQLLAGLLLGPSVFGALWPDAQRALFPVSGAQSSMLEAVSQLGILLLLLMTGMETDLALVRRVRRAAVSVSLAGITLPFLCGFALGEWLPEAMLPRADARIVTALFLGTALSISSVKIVALVVREMGFLRRKVGQVIVASAIIDDTVGWTIIAITFSLARSGKIDLRSVGETLAGTALFLAVSFTLGRRLVFLAIRFANDELHSEAAVVTTILVIMGLLALTTQAIGVHTVLGAFVAGILVGQSPILTRQIDEQLRGLVTGLFAPVFFGLAGLTADLTILQDPRLLCLTAGLIAIASIGKFGGAFVGGRIGGLDRAECFALAAGMNARGSTEVVVATIGLSVGALNENLYTMIVTMAVLTTLAMPPTLRWALARLPVDASEQKLADRDAFEASSFVGGLERLLVAADTTAKGRFAARLAGLIAGLRNMPVTLVQVGEDEAAPTGISDLVRHAAEAAQARIADDRGTAPGIDVIARQAGPQPHRIVEAEAAKGFDMLVVGIEPTAAARGGFNAEAARIACSFDGPFAIVAARGAHVEHPDDAPLSILVAVNGTDVSRRGAEVACALARAADLPVVALYVTAVDARHRRRFAAVRRTQDAVLNDLAAVAARYEIGLRAIVRTDVAAQDAILRQARTGGHNLIVMGVARRPGATLDFGGVAEAVLEGSERSLLFVTG